MILFLLRVLHVQLIQCNHFVNLQELLARHDPPQLEVARCPEVPRGAEVPRCPGVHGFSSDAKESPVGIGWEAPAEYLQALDDSLSFAERKLLFF